MVSAFEIILMIFNVLALLLLILALRHYFAYRKAHRLTDAHKEHIHNFVAEARQNGHPDEHIAHSLRKVGLSRKHVRTFLKK